MGWRRLIFGLALVVAGCSDGSPPDGNGCGQGPGRVQVGQGGTRFRDLPAMGGELGIVRGSQGGIHVLVAFRTWDMGLIMDVVYRLEDADTGEPMGLTTELMLRPGLFGNDGVSAVRNPDLLILDNEAPSIDRFAGRSARLVLEAVGGGSHACDARFATLVPPPE